MRAGGLTIAVIAAFLAVQTAQAGPWDTIYRGLELVATPSGSPLLSSGDGTRFNGARSGRVRIVPNGVVGQGYRLELDRTFGNDSRGRPETFRFGSIGDLTLQGAVQLTAGYNTLPGQGSGRGLMDGFVDFGVTNLAYNLRTKVGVQDAQLTGQLNVNNQLEINSLGFYTLIINANNTNSQLSLDGVVIRSDEQTNFTVGPIVVEGNLFVDGAIAFLGGLGVDTSELQRLFPRSAADQIAAAIDRELQATQGRVAGTTAHRDIAPLLLRSILEQDEAAASALIAGLSAGELTNHYMGSNTIAAVPEPGTLVLLAIGGAFVWSQRRK
ncbi:MAG: PEP-CTERM sorting domain-containing protein [Phycisphaerales bacterium]|nr:PEP-CTERM sorting domain-containing protein [Phycisphaerales bacterium]